MNREEALELIERLPYIRTFQAPNDKILEEFFAEALQQEDPVEWIRVIKTCYVRQEDHSDKRKLLTERERYQGKRAKELLYEMLSKALDQPAEKMEEYIQKHLKEVDW